MPDWHDLSVIGSPYGGHLRCRRFTEAAAALPAVRRSHSERGNGDQSLGVPEPWKRPDPTQQGRAVRRERQYDERHASLEEVIGDGSIWLRPVSTVDIAPRGGLGDVRAPWRSTTSATNRRRRRFARLADHLRTWPGYCTLGTKGRQQRVRLASLFVGADAVASVTGAGRVRGQIRGQDHLMVHVSTPVERVYAARKV